MFVLNDYMKKNLRFITPVAALIVLAIIFGIMYIVNNNSGQDNTDTTEPASTEPQKTMTATEELGQYKIGIMQFDDSQEYSDVYDEFVLAMEHRGFTEGVNV